MRYAKIIKNDIANGAGICVSFFAQGCPHRCKGCHNPETWSTNEGFEYTSETLKETMDAIGANGIKRNLSMLGGEPLMPCNVPMILEVVKTAKELYPNIIIYLWTGYVLENLNREQLEVLKYIDIMIDGRFEEDLKDLTLELRGSSNQRIINIKDLNLLTKAKMEGAITSVKTTRTTGTIRN